MTPALLGRTIPERDARGLPTAGVGLERICRLLAAAASLGVLLVGIWEIAGPFGAGHAAVVPARGIIAENMLEWGILGPVRTYTLHRPPPAMFYANHPWGSFWLQAAAMAVFGRHEATFRLVPVALTALTPWMLWALGRALYSPLAGALAALGYASLPIVLSYANFPGFEGPVSFSCILAAWASLRLLQTERRRWILIAGLAFLAGYHSDWEFYLFAGIVVGTLTLLHVMMPPKWFGGVGRAPLVVWAIVAAALGLASLGFYHWAFGPAGGFGALLEQGRFRAGLHQAPLSEVLERRAYWIEVMFTPVAILVGKLAVPLFLVRLFILRRSVEVFPLAILVMATVHYVVFENGADVHIYWPLPFAPYFGLALGLLGHCAATVFGRIAHAAWPHRSEAPRWGAALATCAVIPASLLPDATRALDYSRDTGLRLNDDGNLNLQDFDKAAALKAFARTIPEDQIVGLHVSLFPNWAQEWLLRRPVRIVDRPPPKGETSHRFLVLDSRFTTGSELRSIAGDYAITAAGPFWLVDGAGAHDSLTAFSIDSREPTLGERLLVQDHDPVYSVAHDAFVQWELDVHFGHPATPPSLTAESAEQRRIAHNVAVHRHDARLADQLLSGLLDGCDRSVATRYQGGIELLAACYSGEVLPRMALYFRTNTPIEADLRFEVRGRLEAKPLLSWVRLDDKIKQLSPGFALPPYLWLPGFVYPSFLELRQRPGRERLEGEWRSLDGSPAPRAIGRTEPIVLTVLP